MSIKSEIERISGNVSDALAATAEMGANVPETASSNDLGMLIRSIPTGGGGGAPSDWNAAEGEPGHVLNRPFYSEVAVGTVLAETSPAFSEEQSAFILTDPITVTTGGEYTVKWNGTEYTCVCGDVDVDGVICQYLGNASPMGGDDTGEPFFMLVLRSELASEMGCTAQILPLDGSTELTISITGTVETVHQIPVKYIHNAAVCIDVETESVNINLSNYDTTEIVDAILNDAAIYVNLNAKSNTDHWSTERLVGVPFFANATTNLNEYQTMKDYILLFLSIGIDPAKIPINLKVHSLAVDKIYTINITNL